MTTLDLFVFGFGLLVSALVCTGLVLLFYGHAYVAQAKRESGLLSSGIQRLAKLLGEDPV